MSEKSGYMSCLIFKCFKYTAINVFLLNPLQIPGNVSSDETKSQLEERILESGSAPTGTGVSFIFSDSWCLFRLDPCHAK